MWGVSRKFHAITYSLSVMRWWFERRQRWIYRKSVRENRVLVLAWTSCFHFMPRVVLSILEHKWVIDDANRCGDIQPPGYTLSKTKIAQSIVNHGSTGLREHLSEWFFIFMVRWVQELSISPVASPSGQLTWRCAVARKQACKDLNCGVTFRWIIFNAGK